VSARRWDEGGRPVDLEPRPGEDVVGIRTFGTHPALFVYDPVALWRELGREVDVLDIHEEPFALATVEVLALRALRQVVTRQPRKLAPYALYSAQNLAKRYPPPFRWLERAALRHAAAISVCNAAAGRIVRGKGFRGAVYEIPLGIDPAIFQPGDRPERSADANADADAGNSPIRVGYAGRLEEHKGVRVLLDAVASDTRLRLELAGDGSLRDEIAARAASSGGRVTPRGPLGTAALADFYRSLDVLAVPSLETPGWVEQFGRVAAEAMACGIPVVASSTGALPDVVGGAGLLVPPDDPDALRDALVRIGSDADLAAELRDAGIERAATCTWTAVADDYLAMYAEMTEAPAPGPVSTRATGTAGPRREVEVVVVAYGRPDLLKEALSPVAAHFPVTVVDNSSSPDVRDVAEAAGARYLDPGRNGGFAAGVNVALADRERPDADIRNNNPQAV
jgi:glycosyltransferase involved in cell wall biosynthesis